jgi:DNA ligase-associated metallophosphoesterase
MEAVPFSFQGEQLLLHPSGTLFWPRLSLLAVADLHLEKGSACAGGGHLVPPWDSAITLARLASAIHIHAPTTVVAVGDSFHDNGAAARLCAADLAVLASLTARARFVWVRGNHDPAPPVGIEGESAPEFSAAGLIFRHQAQPAASGEISGHYHPKCRVETRAAGIARPCFMTSAQRIILPSFGAYTGGLDVRSTDLARLFPAGGQAFLLGRERVFSFAVAPPGTAAPARPLVSAAVPHRFPE